MKAISFYTRYTRLGASSRVRTFQFLPYLSTVFKIQQNSFFSEKYLQCLYNNKSQNTVMILWAYIKRFFKLMFDKSDILIIEKELFPYLPFWFGNMFLRKKKFIIDIDDAWFHHYDLHRKKIVRMALGQKIYKLFAKADMVFAGSPYLCSIALKYNQKVVFLPSVIDIGKYILPKQFTNSNNVKNRVVVGWIGTMTTVRYLDMIISALDKVQQKLPDVHLVLLVVGATIKYYPKYVRVIEKKWTEDNEVELIHKMDIGVMPLFDTVWERGKCAYKLIQYMACSKPVIASAVGANNVVVDNEINGYLCSTDEEWKNSLIRLIMDKNLRQSMGERGRLKVEANYTVQANAPIIIKNVNEILCVE